MAMLYKNMGEKYAEMGAAADGMKTSAEAVAEVTPVWEELRSGKISWMWVTTDGKKYTAQSKGGGGAQEMVDAASKDGVQFGGMRVVVKGAGGESTKFVHVLYIGPECSALKKGKAALWKSAAFNAMPGAAGELGVSEELTIEVLEAAAKSALKTDAVLQLA